LSRMRMRRFRVSDFAGSRFKRAEQSHPTRDTERFAQGTLHLRQVCGG
jgi:hypothetical protein